MRARTSSTWRAPISVSSMLSGVWPPRARLIASEPGASPVHTAERLRGQLRDVRQAIESVRFERREVPALFPPGKGGAVPSAARPGDRGGRVPAASPGPPVRRRADPPGWPAAGPPAPGPGRDTAPGPPEQVRGIGVNGGAGRRHMASIVMPSGRDAGVAQPGGGGAARQAAREERRQGTLKIVELTTQAGLPPLEIECLTGEVTVRFRPAGVCAHRVGHDLSPLQRQLLEVLARVGRRTWRECGRVGCEL